MIDDLIQQFLQNPTENNANNILFQCRIKNLFNIGVKFGEYVSNLFPHCIYILEEYALLCHYSKDYIKAYEIFERILGMKGISEEVANKNLFNQHFCMDHIENRYVNYNKDKVDEIMKRQPSDIPLVTLTMTTCKRFDLFQITVNSILNCLDIEMIDFWLCVDDNSSEEDRNKMKELYPFFTFVFKNKEDKGHPRSMNIIKRTVKTPYFFHLEDDFKFFAKRNYIRDAMDVLNSDRAIGQCLINKNYSEIERDIGIKGGIFKKTDSGLRYYIHEFVQTEEEKAEWNKKHGFGSSSNYWPHFSLRPSLLRTGVINEIGDFHENVGHFEMEYAYRYAGKGYVSAFFEGIYCFHTGRLTSEKHDETKINAYKLNNEDQFVKKSLSPIDETVEIELSTLGINIKTYVLNLDRRRDRWDNFRKIAKPIEFLEYERFSAVDGSFLQSTTQLQRIFDGNDYNMMVGAVGCAMSHFKMHAELINSEYDSFLILEDDITFAEKFDVKFLHLCNELKNTEWDIVFIGHHIRDTSDEKYTQTDFPTLEKWDVYTSFSKSLGGTIGYMISKTGAKKFLDFVNANRLINCVDTALQKSANELNVFYITPHLVFSECFRRDVQEQKLDTDIQNNYKSLTVSLDDKIKYELDFYKENNIEIEEVFDIENIIEKLNSEISFVGYYKGDIAILRDNCKSKNIKYYTYEESVIFIVKSDIVVDRYYHIFKRGNDYTLKDSLKFN